MKKIVYVALSADILHEGHINVLKKASKFEDSLREFISFSKSYFVFKTFSSVRKRKIVYS